MYRLFSWEHSYFSGKARAYLRFKQRAGDLEPGYEDILATMDLLIGLLAPKSGTPAVPQMLAPDGTWIQDTSEIIDYCEARHTKMPIVPDVADAPRQHLLNYLIELFADEWMIVPAFWERWYYSEDGRQFSHRKFNEQQWGAPAAADQPGTARRQAGADLFENAMGISHSRENPIGAYAGLAHLGCDTRTEKAWEASQHRVLSTLEKHFDAHDYVFGGRPSLADFALLGPLYAHLFRDPVSGFELRTEFPLTTEWVERTNGEGALNARMWGQKLYAVGDDGTLIPRPATSHGGEWLPDDQIPETLTALVEIFFDEMWPVLKSSAATLTSYIASDAHADGGELPGKSFIATPDFLELQTGDGPLTHQFSIGGVRSRRMVIPYQIWMLQRLEDRLNACLETDQGKSSVTNYLSRMPSGSELLGLNTMLSACRVRKEGGLLYSQENVSDA